MFETSNVPPDQVSSGEVAGVAVHVVVVASFRSSWPLRGRTAKRMATTVPHLVAFDRFGSAGLGFGHRGIWLMSVVQTFTPVPGSAMPSGGAMPVALSTLSTPTPYCACRETTPSTSPWAVGVEVPLPSRLTVMSWLFWTVKVMTDGLLPKLKRDALLANCHPLLPNPAAPLKRGSVLAFVSGSR